MLRFRVEFVTLGAGRGQLGGQIDLGEGVPLGAAALDVPAGGAPSGTLAAPASSGQVFAQIAATGGPVYVAIGPSPDPTLEPRRLVLPGVPLLLHVSAGDLLAAAAAGDVAPAEAAGGAVSTTSPALTSGDRAPLSLNTHGAVRTVAQNPDGTDLDPGAPTQTVPARSGTITVAQVSVGSAAPTVPALAANLSRKHARLTYRAGGANLYWAPTAALATTALGCFVPPGGAFDLPPGYTGDVFLVADAAGPTAASISQLA